MTPHPPTMRGTPAQGAALPTIASRTPLRPPTAPLPPTVPAAETAEALILRQCAAEIEALAAAPGRRLSFVPSAVTSGMAGDDLAALLRHAAMVAAARPDHTVLALGTDTRRHPLHRVQAQAERAGWRLAQLWTDAAALAAVLVFELEGEA